MLESKETGSGKSRVATADVIPDHGYYSGKTFLILCRCSTNSVGGLRHTDWLGVADWNGMRGTDRKEF